MSKLDVAPELFRHKEEFLAQATERLGMHSSDYCSEMEQIHNSGSTIAPCLAAGVLLPLIFCGSPSHDDSVAGQFVFQLIKRSSQVSQPGDLSCPGGMIHPVTDRLLRPLMLHGPLPIIRGPARTYALRRDPKSLRIITLFLANALRESWEEIGLSPFHVRFLGPLPTHSLTRFCRTIFPLAGFVELPVTPRPNREVERIVDIPLSSFFRKELIGSCILSGPDTAETASSEPFRRPCLIHRDPVGGEEILWGATFQIIIQFLEIVMDYQLPDWTKGPVIQKKLSSGYLSGRSRS